MQSRRKVVIGGVALFVSLSLLLGSAVAADPTSQVDPLAVYFWGGNTNQEIGSFYNANSGSSADGVWGRTAGSIGVYGASYGYYGQGVRGYASKTKGYGVYGRSVNYIGVRGMGGSGSSDYGGYFTGYEGVRGVASGYSGYGTWGTASGTGSIGAYGSSSGSSGHGVYGYSTYYIGARGNGDDYGVYGAARNSAGQGVRGYNAGSSGYGVYGYAPYNIGVRGQGGSGSGDYGGYFTGYEGVRGIAAGSNGYGTWGTAYGSSGIGAYGWSSGYYGQGVRGYASGTRGWGGSFVSSNYRGLYANGASGWFDAYFPDFIYVGGTTYSSAGMSFIALNDGSVALEPGDLVAFSGFDESAQGSSGPRLAVTKVDGANSRVIIGVVQSAYVKEDAVKMAMETKSQSAMDEVPLAATVDTAIPRKEDLALPPLESREVAGEEAPSPLPQPEEALPEVAPEVAPELATPSVQQMSLDTAVVDAMDGHFVEGAAQPGQYVLVLVQGITRVKVDASAALIRAGDMLTASAAGYAINATAALEPGKSVAEFRDRGSFSQVLTIGRALESLETGIGAIYVYVSVR